MPDIGQRQRRTGFRIRTFLLVPFIGFIVVAIGVPGWISFRNGQRSAEEICHRLLAEINARISDHLAAFLKEAVHVNGLNARAIAQGVLDPRNQAALQQYFLREIREFETVSSAYFGTPEGGLADAGREGSAGSLYVMGTDGAGPGRLIKRSLDANDRPAALLSAVPAFDARTRPWFIGALKRPGASWTAPYVLSTGQDMAISTSQAVTDATGRFLGVVSSDIFLSQLGVFMRTIPVGATGDTFVMEPTGLLVSSSDDDAPFLRQAGRDTLYRREARDSSSPAIRAAAEAIGRRVTDLHALSGDEALAMSLAGKRMFVEVSPFRGIAGLDWIVVSVVPDTDFTAGIDATTRATLISLLAALLVAIGLAMLLTRLIAAPILRLHRSTKATVDGAWAGEVADGAWIVELRELTSSFNAMVGRVRSAVRDLRAEVDERARAEATARVAEEKYRVLFESFPEGVIVADEEGRIVEINRAAESLLEMRAGELLGRPIHDLGRQIIGLDGAPIPPEQLVTVRALKEGRPVQGFVSGVVLESGRISWLGVNAAPIPLPGYGVAAAFTDVTERRNAERERERLIAELQEALRNVKQLSGLLPICSHCKKIRDDQGYWHQVETYVSHHTDAGFTHSLCPECIKKYYPEVNL